MATASPAKKSDLGVRTLSAIVMLAVVGGALWLGGWWWTGLVGVVAVGVLWEWWALVRQFAASPVFRLVWPAAGLIYISLAAWVLLLLRSIVVQPALIILALVIAIDVGAYVFGRTIGGPKIAPTISPSKTWAGFLGGVVGAAAVLAFNDVIGPQEVSVFHQIGWPIASLTLFLIAAIAAIVAQSGDFFESWMKRRAGVKDSGNLIPGHGGLFDRVDGLLAVCFVLGVIVMVSRLWGGS